MSTSARVAGFLIGLVALFGAAYGVGTQAGPLVEPVQAHGTGGGHASGSGAGHDEGSEGGATAVPGGLMVSQAGYGLRLSAATLAPGLGRELAFTVIGPDGAPVTSYDEQHEKDLHLVVVRRDLSGFQHVHPTLGADGTWRVPVDLTPGAWRVLADFDPADGPALILGADLAVPGTSSPDPRQAPARTAEVDGYTVGLTGDLIPGEDSPVSLDVRRGGAPVTDLEPYLGARGHLVALREGDLAYLHVHPEEVHEGEYAVEFVAEVPSTGRYHLYLDFKHDGVVRTAHFVLDAAAGPSMGGTR